MNIKSNANQRQDYKGLFFIVLSLSLLSCGQQTVESLVIAGASNMQFALGELIDSFGNQEHISCKLVNGSSGKLTAQIMEGAPYDVFLSADMKYPESLYTKNLASKPNIFAEGKLVLWTNYPNVNLNLQAISKDKTKMLALANPELAPYGLATKDYLKEKNLYHKLQNQLVFGENISQTSQFILSKSVYAGFTAKSVVLASGIKDKGAWEDIHCKSCLPIYQGAVILKNDRNKSREAEKFIRFLLGEKGQKILNKYGYSTTFDANSKKQN